MGIVDEDGYVHIVGRRKDVVIREGVNVHPIEVEDRLMAHPAVERAAVVGVPDEILGEAICACVVQPKSDHRIELIMGQLGKFFSRVDGQLVV